MTSHRLLAFLISLSLFFGVMVSAAPVAAQDPGGPPTIQPSDEAQGQEQGQEPAQGQGNGGILQLNFELGNGGQPADFPREVIVDGARFLFDRMVPATRQDLISVAQEGPIQAFATTDAAPFDAIYLSVPPRNETELGRYLPEQIGAVDIFCQADAGTFEPLDAEGTIYVFAGLETFLTPSDLEEVATDSNGQPVYADPGSGQPFPELFFTDPSGLVRFVLTTESGVPLSLSESLAIDGAQFAFQGEVTGQVDVASLPKIGCAGPFAVYSDADPASGARYVIIGQRVFQYVGDGQAAAATEIPATPIPTDAPTETALPTETPTVEPTATAEPTLTPTEKPSVTPEPTQTPTVEPTATTEPTQTPTVEPTATPEPTLAAATEAPSATPTEEPTTPVEPAATTAATWRAHDRTRHYGGGSGNAGADRRSITQPDGAGGPDFYRRTHGHRAN